MVYGDSGRTSMAGGRAVRLANALMLVYRSKSDKICAKRHFTELSKLMNTARENIQPSNK